MDLGNNHILWLGRKDFTFLGVKVRIVRVDVPLVIRCRRTPRDAEVDIVVLETNEGECRLPVLTEVEAEGVETRGRGTWGTTEEITTNRLWGGGRQKGWGDESGEG